MTASVAASKATEFLVAFDCAFSIRRVFTGKWCMSIFGSIALSMTTVTTVVAIGATISSMPTRVTEANSTRKTEANAMSSIRTNSASMFSVVSAVASYPSSVVISAIASPVASPVVSAVASAAVVSAVASAAVETVTVIAHASFTAVKASMAVMASMAVKASMSVAPSMALSIDSTESTAMYANGSILGSSGISVKALRNFLRFFFINSVLRERSVSFLQDWLASSVIRSDVVGAVRLRIQSLAGIVTILMLAGRSMSVLLLLEEAVVPLMSFESTLETSLRFSTELVG